jgi:hypothetical protein
MYIYDRKAFGVKTAMVNSVSQPHISKAAQGNPALAFQGFVVDVSLSVDGDTKTVEFPVNSVSASYAEQGWFMSYDSSVVTREIESSISAAKQFLSQVPLNERIVKDGPELISQLNPSKRIEEQSMREIAGIREELAEFKRLLMGMSSGIAKKEEQ